MNTLDPELLRCFVTVVESGNFTSAGNRLGLSQSGVSLRIKRLEEVLNCRLFDRTSRSVVLSTMGKQLLGDAERIIELNESVIRRFNEPETNGQLRIGFADYVINGTLQKVLARFKKYYPKIRLEVVTGLGLELIPRFEEDGLDLIVAGIENASGDVVPLYTEPLQWCVAKEFIVDANEALPIVSLPHPCSHRSAGINTLSEIGREWIQVFTGTSVAGVREAACAGLGVAVLPASAFDEKCHQLGEADEFPALPSTEIGAYIRPDASDPARAFLDFFQEESPWTQGRR